MSQIAVAEFMNVATKNPHLLSQIESAQQGRSVSEVGEAIAVLGAAAGFQFSGADALAFREQALARVKAVSGANEDSILEGVRGGSGQTSYAPAQQGASGGFGGPPGSFQATYTTAQLEALQVGLGLAGPTGTGMGVGLATGAAQGDLGGAAISAAQDMEEAKSVVQQAVAAVASFFSSW